MIPYSDITSAMNAKPALTDDVISSLKRWYQMYTNNAEWLREDHMKSLNLPAFICSEIAKAVTLEMKWNITGKNKDGSTKDENGDPVMNERAQFLKQEFERNIKQLRQKLEQGIAAGGMTIKPYVKGDRIHFDWTMDWSLHPIAFDDDGFMTDVIFSDCYTKEGAYYTRLERHTLEDTRVKITQRVFKSTMEDSLGKEVSLNDVDIWADLAPEAYVNYSGGSLFGWYKVAQANSLNTSSPMGLSGFHRAEQQIHDADEQYSRLLWEYEGSELAIDVDPLALRPRSDGGVELPRLNERLFRGVDLGTDSYNIFSPQIRDASLINGLNRILTHIEDLCGLSRGTLTETPVEAKTATELKILRQRAYITVHDNQIALENCLRDVIRAMNVYASLYDLAPEGEYDVSFEWDDSIITDMTQQLNERMLFYNSGLMSAAEMRMWYLGETESQAQAAIAKILQEKKMQMEALQPLDTPVLEE